MSNNADYYIGLDCGTSSVGWAVTDSNYEVLKFRGSYMWGVRLFDEASTAQDRRMQRCARRRLERRRQRLNLLQELFKTEIDKVDPLFFDRLNESGLIKEDKTNTRSKYSLFNDKDFTDKDFGELFPTIFHLRKALIDGTAPHDVRLVYLAIHHILKNRGHFLFSNSNSSDGKIDIKATLEELEDISNQLYESVSFGDAKFFEKTLMEKSCAKRKSALINIIDTGDTKLNEMIAKVIAGYKIKPSALFRNEEYKDLPELEYRSSSFDETKLSELESSLTGEEYKFILLTKSLYDWSVVAFVLNGERYISEGKVRLYDQNKEDLRLLKSAIQRYKPNEFDKFFNSSSNKAGFSAYIGKNHSHGKNKTVKRCSTDDFHKEISKLLKDIKGDNEVDDILSRVDDGTFMPLLISFRNGVIPYQVNKSELIAILNNASEYLPFLKAIDPKYQITTAEKIVEIMGFRIPYYVGPLGKNGSNDPNCWVVRHTNERVLPWNFNEVVDEEVSAKNFIERMTNHCQYLPDERVLPKNSILYSSFMVLNVLNNLKVNDDRLTVLQKQNIFEDLFMNQKSVTLKALEKYMVNKGWYRKGEVNITGVDTASDFKVNLSAYLIFKPYIEDQKLTQHEVEEIIEQLTIFSDGGKILNEWLKNRFSKKLSNEDIRKISSIKLSGWGSLSRKFLLHFEGYEKSSDEYDSIIHFLWNSNNNLMQLLSGAYTFVESLPSKKQIEAISYDIVDDLYVSPSVKRQIWQTLKVVSEIRKAMGHDPAKVFIEVTRSEEEKKRTRSRKDTLLDAYKNLTKEDKELLINLGHDTFNTVSESLKESEESLISKRDRLYLYYSQMGRCMYSGQPIDIEDLDSVNVYDIDHIYPYSKSDDDSLTNKVLVCSKYNREKTNEYPIKEDIRKKMTKFWKMLVDKNLISKEKFYRLVRPTRLTEEDEKGFIGRQLVETSQSTKATADILRRFFDSNVTKVVYSKARKVSEFRQKYEIYKARSINDLHHAKDAYLNIVVGNLLDVKYSAFFNKKHDNVADKNLSRAFEYDVEGAWIAPGKNGLGTLKTVNKYLVDDKPNMEMTILHTRQLRKGHGQLFDLNLIAKGGKQGLLPQKSSDNVFKLYQAKYGDKAAEEWTKRYGGYNSLKTSHFAAFVYEKKGKRFLQFVAISIIDAKRLKTDNEYMEFLEKTTGLKVSKLISTDLALNTLIQVDGYSVRITGKGGPAILLRSDVPLCLSNSNVQYVKKIEKLNERLKKYKNYEIDEIHDGVSVIQNNLLYNALVGKCELQIYSNRLCPKNDAILSSKINGKFEELSFIEQISLLTNLLIYFSMSNGESDLTLIGESNRSGTLKMSANVDLSKKSVIIINQSTTGLYTNKIVVQ